MSLTDGQKIIKQLIFNKKLIYLKMLFSIIMPTYNRSELISKAIESVINQSYEKWELIIIDDGSTDNTYDIVNKFISSENRIKYFFQKNQERSAARNNGIRNSNGNWICFLDSDDIFHKTHLEKFSEEIKKTKFSKGLYISGLSINKFSKAKEKYDISGKNNLEFVMLNTIGTPRACVSKSILYNHYFNIKLTNGEDRELWVRILNENLLFYHSNKTFIEIHHPKRSVNTTRSKHESLKTLKFIIKSNKNKIRVTVRRQCLSNSYFSLAKSYINDKRLTIALYYLFRSILTNLQNPQTRHKILLVLSILGFYNKKVKSGYELLN